MLMLTRFWGLAVTVLVLDQWTKYLAENHLPAHRSVPLLSGIVSLTYVRNPGTAFGLLHGSGRYLVAIFSPTKIKFGFGMYCEFSVASRDQPPTTSNFCAIPLRVSPATTV